MEKEQLLQILKDKREKIDDLEKLKYNSEEFTQWHDSVENILRKAFGDKSAEYTNFSKIHFLAMVLTMRGGDNSAEDQEAYISGLKKARSKLASIIEQIELFDYSNKTKSEKQNNKTGLIQHFHFSQSQIQQIENKIDIQTLDPEVKKQLDLLFRELSKEEGKNKLKIGEIIKWLADKAIDVLIAIITAKIN